MSTAQKHVVAVCVVCRKGILGNMHMTRSKYCGRCFDAVQDERLKLMRLIGKAAVRRVQRRFGKMEVE